MQPVASLISNVEAELKADLRARELAQVEGLRDGARALEKDLEAMTAAAGLGKLARAWESRVYPSRGGSLSAAALIYPKGGERIQKAFEAFTHGAVVTAKGAKHLAIPTNFNRMYGRRRTGRERENVAGAVRVTPEEMIRSGMSFTLPRRDGPGLNWMLKVTVAQRRTARRRTVKDMAYAGGLVQVGTSSAKMLRRVLAAGAVPMYVLLPLSTLARRLNPSGPEGLRRAQLPALIEARYRAHRRG